MINWKRFGYGTSYHNNGLIEYEGYWCDDNRFGIGKVYDRYGKLPISFYELRLKSISSRV